MMYPNATKADIAEKMGINKKTLYNLIQDGYEQNLLSFSDPLEQIDHQLIPKIVKNLNFFLDQQDKTVTIEAAKGTIFKSYAEAKGITEGGQTILALRIEQPDGGEVKVLAGRILGKPKDIEDDIIDIEAE